MGCIVCATRGGEGSRAVQERAIHYAHERDCKLVFLYIIDLAILDDFDQLLLPAVRDEMKWLGRTLLGVALRRASRTVKDVDLVIREGQVQKEIAHFLRESSADLFLLGAPRGTTANVFGDDAIEQFAAEIEAETGVPVEIARPEEVLN